MNLGVSETYSQQQQQQPNFPFLNVSGKPFTKHRIGLLSDNYVIVDESGYDFYILAGVSQNELFSKLVMLNLDIDEGCAFDGSIQNIPSNFPLDRMKIIKKDVSIPNIIQNSTNLKYFVMNYHDIFLKMDIKGAEYLWFLSLSEEEVLHFKQIVITFYQVNQNPTKNRAMNKINCFTKLFETHDVVNVDFKDANTLTVTYFRKDYEEEKDEKDEKEEKNMSSLDILKSKEDPIFTEMDVIR